MAEKKDEVVQVKFTTQRIEDTVSVGEFIQVYSGNFGTIIALLAKMVIDADGNYVTEAEGLEQIKGVKMGELRRLAKDLQKSLKEQLVNPTSGGG